MSDCVVLLHGILSNRRRMEPIERFLLNHGYTVFNQDYPSRLYPIEALAKLVFSQIQQQRIIHARTMHLVTFSMGGLVARTMIERFQPHNLGRVVMIAPPLKGSEGANWWGRLGLYHKVYGPAGSQLCTTHSQYNGDVYTINYELGIIAGNRSFDLGFSKLIFPGPNDGQVAVESTKLEGMRDHVIIAATHRSLLRNKKTLNQILAFLRRGHFDK